MRRTLRHFTHIVFAIALVAAAVAPARAQSAADTTDSTGVVSPGPSRTLLLTPIEAAKLAITVGNYTEADELLQGILAKEPSSSEALFLMGTMKTRQKKFADAVPYYREILVDHPDIVRVRLDLGRALFECQEDDAAAYNFHLALAAGTLPDTVIDNVERYLAIIRSRQHFVYDINVGIAPDTNINAASSSSTVTVLGLPFTVTSQARSHSGIGFTATLDGEYRYDLQPDLRVRSGAVLTRVEYPSNSIFDDMQARAYIGPEKFFTNGNINVLGVVAERWFGNRPYSVGVGGRLEGEYWLTRQFLYSGYLEGLSMSYRQQPTLKGYYFDQGNFLDYYLTPSSFLRGTVGIGYQNAQLDLFSNWYYRLGLAYQQEFAWGITANIAPELRWTDYSGFNGLFGNRRRDNTYSTRLAVYKRNLTFFGFAPVLSFTYTLNRSDQEIFNFHRAQFQLGVTKQF